MASYVRKIVDGVEGSVHREQNRIMHSVDCHFGGLDLLWSNFAVGSKKMCKDSTDAVGVLSCDPVEDCAKVDRVNRINYLRNKRFFCGLAEFECQLVLASDVPGVLNLGVAGLGGSNGPGLCGVTHGTE